MGNRQNDRHQRTAESSHYTILGKISRDFHHNGTFVIRATTATWAQEFRFYRQASVVLVLRIGYRYLMDA